MTTHTIPQTVLFPDLFDKPLVATFDRQHASSDGGAVLLKAAERLYGLVAGFARCLVDRREPGKIRHTLAELLGQRIFGIACGHPDGNDADHLAADPIHKLLLGRDPVAGEALASQPTISRFENGVGRSALYELARELAMRVIERHQRRLDGRARRITIDLDPTDDATHGAQQLTFFNGHYDSWCYLPLLAFLTFDQEREQYLCAAVLRPGNVPATRGTVGVLCRLLPLLRQAFPQARFLVRLDGGFATPEIFDFLDAEPRLDYVVAMAKNAVLQRHAEPALIVAQAQSAASGQTAHVYADTRYRARTWDRDRRVVIKAEVVRLGDREPRDNPRFVVTNLRQTPRFVYERIYCARGDIENRIKETARWPADRPHELLSLLGQSTARAPHRRRLRADARTPPARGAHRLCPCPSDVAPRPAPQIGGARRRFGPPRGPAPADRHAGPPRLAAHRACTRRPRRIGPSQRPSAAHTRIPTAHRARPWRSRPWTAPTQAFRTDNQLLSRRRPTKATPGGPCARRSHRPLGRLGPFLNNPG